MKVYVVYEQSFDHDSCDTRVLFVFANREDAESFKTRAEHARAEWLARRPEPKQPWVTQESPEWEAYMVQYRAWQDTLSNVDGVVLAYNTWSTVEYHIQEVVYVF